MSMNTLTPQGQKFVNDTLAGFIAAAVAAERERCAKIVDNRAAKWKASIDAHGDCAMPLWEECEDIAAAIRKSE